MLRSNIYPNIHVNTQRFVRTQYEYWILKNFKCTMKLEKFSCMLRGVAGMEGKVITKSDRNYKSWKIVVWPTNILPLMSIKFYSAGSAWNLRSKHVSCSSALMVRAWGEKKNLEEGLKSKLRYSSYLILHADLERTDNCWREGKIFWGTNAKASLSEPGQHRDPKTVWKTSLVKLWFIPHSDRRRRRKSGLVKLLNTSLREGRLLVSRKGTTLKKPSLHSQKCDFHCP